MRTMNLIIGFVCIFGSIASFAIPDPLLRIAASSFLCGSAVANVLYLFASRAQCAAPSLHVTQIDDDEQFAPDHVRHAASFRRSSTSICEK